ncbi:hypothetical protein BDV06DRAFT_193468 [Aspergillus oleicola]
MESLPSELLLEIFSYLPFTNRYPLLFVSHKWFEHLKAGIWKEVYDHRLLNVTSGRRQMYASAIEALTLTSHKPYIHEELQELGFTRLNTLIFQISLDRLETSFNTSCLLTYLVPTLKSVTLDLVADADLLNRLASNCNLRHIAMDIRAKRLTEDSVLEYIERCPDLEHIGFYNGHHSYTSDRMYHGDFSPRILRQLAMQASLRQIDLHHSIHESTIAGADLPSIPQPFASIERVETRESVIPILPMHIALHRMVDELYVQLNPNSRPATIKRRASAIPASTEPRHLNIRRQGLPFVHPTYITVLESVSGLKNLYIDARNITFKGHPLNNNDFRLLVSKMAYLRRLVLDCPQANVTTECLIALAECCPYIQTLSIPWLQVEVSCLVPSPEDQDLNATHREGPRPLLPRLKELNVNNLMPPTVSKCGESASILAVLFPEVIRVGSNKFHGSTMEELTKRVEEAWAELRAEEGRPLELGWKPEFW